jgi:hypothetical protein
VIEDDDEHDYRQKNSAYDKPERESIITNSQLGWSTAASSLKLVRPNY